MNQLCPAWRKGVLQGSLEGKSLTTYDNRLRAKYLVLTLFPSLEG
jgi:hypothetical protein